MSTRELNLIKVHSTLVCRWQEMLYFVQLIYADSKGKECKSWSQLVFHCCDKGQDQKQLGEERMYLVIQDTVHHQGTPRQELKGGADAEATEGCCFLACSP